MNTEWLVAAANGHVNHLVEARRDAEARKRADELEQSRKSRLESERASTGLTLWSRVQEEIKYCVRTFNETIGWEGIRTETRGDGTVKIILKSVNDTEKIAAVSYSPETFTLSWQVFGGATGIPIAIGLKSPMDAAPGFLNGNTYVDPEEISKQILLALLN